MIRGVAHIGVAVRSIDEGRLFYEALGLEIEAVEEVESEGVRVAMIACGETHIELLEPTSDDSPIAKFLDKRGPGIHHLCFATDDVRADDQRLRDAGLQVLRDEPSRGAGDCRVQFVHPKSAGGVLVELSEPPVQEAPSRARVIAPGSTVVVNLREPNEKYWGALVEMQPFGLTLHCLSVTSFDDWTRSIIREQEPSLGLATVFFPMARLERMFLDERVGDVESMSEAFERQVGRSVADYLG
jgi:methylmalonyl-CoA/ethylmalonyl-CoA epimerase